MTAGTAICALVAGFTVIPAQAQLTGTTTATTTSGTATSTTATASTTPVISAVVGLSNNNGTAADIMWTTNINSTSQVAYATTTPYTNFSAVNSSLVANHSVNLSNLLPGTLYHFQAISSDVNGMTATSSDQTFTTVNPGSQTGTTTSTTTVGTTGTGGLSTDAIQDEIKILQGQVAALQSQLAMIVARLNPAGSGNGNIPSSIPSPAAATLMPSSETVGPGTVVDWNGRSFGHEETVNVTRNGQIVAIAHADGGGNFTTGSFTLPMTPGTYVYTFTGVTSGTSLTSTITVQ